MQGCCFLGNGQGFWSNSFNCATGPFSQGCKGVFLQGSLWGLGWGNLFFLKGVNTIFGLGLNWEALLSSDSLGLGVGVHCQGALLPRAALQLAVVVEKANALDETCFYWCMWLALCKQHSHQHGISCHCGSFQIQCMKETKSTTLINVGQFWSNLINFGQFWSKPWF